MGIVVTATAGGSTANGIRMRVRSLRNAAGIQNGATAVQSGVAAHDVSLTTTVNGSRCYGSFIDASNTAFTGDTGMTVVDNVSDAANTVQHGTGHGVNTVTPGVVTLGASAPADAGGCAFCEMLPVSGSIIAEDVTGANGSTTGITTSVTLSPPPGTLLVAMVTSNGGAAVTTMTVSDSSGLAWTEIAAANTAGQKYAGVWLAFMPQQGYAPAAYAPLWLPGDLPGMPDGTPFAPWPVWDQAPAAPTGPVTATGSMALPLPTLAGTATEASTSSGSAALPHPALAGTAAEIFTITGSLALPHPAAGGSALAAANAPTAYAPLAPAWRPGPPSMPGGTPFAPWPPWDQLALPVVTALAAAGSVTLPHPGLSGTATETSKATGSAALQRLGMAGTATGTQHAAGTVALPRLAITGNVAVPLPTLANATSAPLVTAPYTSAAIITGPAPSATVTAQATSAATVTGSQPAPAVTAPATSTPTVSDG